MSRKTIDNTSRDVSDSDSTRIAGENLTSKERQKLCWNFPRVKLRLFTAKSLEDILGSRSSHNRKGHQSSECSSSGGVGVGVSASSRARVSSTSSTSTSVVQPNNPNQNQTQSSHSQLKQFLGKNAHTQSNSNLSIRDSKSKIISVSNHNTPQVLSASSSENNCHYISAAEAAASSSSSSSAAHRKRTSTEENPSLSSPSLLTAVGLRKKSVPYSPHSLEVPERSNNKNSGNNSNNSNKKSDVVVNSVGNVKKIIPRVKCAKSDNCLHRIVSTACTKFSSSSVDNLDTEIRDQKSKSKEKLVSASSDSSLTTGLLPPLKITGGQQLEEKEKKLRFLKKQQQTENSKGLKKISAPKKKTQVSPVDEIFNYNSSIPTTTTSRDDTSSFVKSPLEINQKQLQSQSHSLQLRQQKISPSDEIPISTIISNNSNINTNSDNTTGIVKEDPLKTQTTMTKEKAKLVVANVGYLQRPLSPTPATNFGFSVGPNPNFTSPSIPIPIHSPSSNISYNNTNTNNNHVFRSSQNQYQPQPQPQHPNNNANMTAGFGFGSVNKNSNTLYSNNLSPVECSSRNISQWPTPLSSASSSSYPKCANLSYNYYSDSADPAGKSGSGAGSGLSSFQIQPKLDHDNTGLLQSTGLIADRRRQQRLRALSPLPFPFPAEQINNNASPRLQHQYQTTSNKCESSLKDQRNYSQTRFTGRQIDNVHGSNISSVLGQETSKETEMGDLQSPQYVKRTAHMFDSRYTSKVNGSTVDEEHESNGDEASLLQDSSTLQYTNQPSYLNVSRSVCGYSCISYNNGTTTTTSSSITNGGVSSSINNCKPSRPSGVHSDFQIGYRPTATTTRFQTNNINNKSEFKSTNGSGNISGGGSNREQKTSILKSEIISTEIENNHNSSSGSYTPGRTASKNILEKIERLYGTNAAASTALWRRPTPLISTGTSPITTTSTQYSRSVPTSNNNITVLNENLSSNKKSNEKIIPIVLEGSISQQKHQIRQIGEVNEYANGSSNVKSQTFKTVKYSSSSIDRDSPTDKLNLHSNQDLLNANEQQKLHQQDLHDKRIEREQAEDYSSSITPVISRTKSNSSKLNGNTLNHQQQQQRNIPVTQEISELKLSKIQKSQENSSDITNNSIIKPSPTEIITTTTMVSDTTPDSFAKKIIPTTTTNLKTEDIIDGDFKPTFTTTISNLQTIENIDENASNKRLPTTNFTTTLGKVEADLNTSDQKENVCCSGEPSVVEKNGEYFLAIVAKERSQIESMIKEAEARLDKLDTSDEQSADYEFSGKILAAIGKARLLVNKKFKQFEGLCNDNMEQRNKGVGSDEPFTTKNDDLAGFWDMVLIQVEQIHSMLKDLDNKEGPKTLTKDTKVGNGNRKIEPVKKPAPTKVSTTTKSPGSSTRDELRRKMLNERRKAMKQQQSAQDAADIQIFAPDDASSSQQ